MPDPDRLVVGHVTKPHGIKGEVLVWPLTDRPEQVYAAGREVLVGDERGDATGEEIAVVERSRPYRRGLLVKFRGYEDRTAVERLSGRYLLAPIEHLEPLEDGELYYHQLIGLEVVTTEGRLVGRVREVYETEPAHLLEVKGEEGAHLIPLSERVVKHVDLAAGRVLIEPPPGLLDL